MAQTVKKNLTNVALIVAANNIEAFDVTNQNGVSCMVQAPAGATGSVKLQFSNINSTANADWTDIPGATVPTGTLVANGSVTISSVTGVRAAFVRAVVTLTAGAGNYNVFYLAKEY